MEIDESMLSIIKVTNSGDYAVYSVENGALVPLLSSPGLCSLSGMTEEEYNKIIENDAANIVLESDRPAVAMKLGEILKYAGESSDFTLTYRIKNKVHGAIWVRAKASRIGERKGAPVLIVSFATIASTSSEYANLINYLGTSVYVIDKANYELLYVNDTALRKYENKDYNNAKCFSFFNGLESPCPWCSLHMMQKGHAHVDSNYVPPLNRWFSHDVRDINWYGHDAAAFYITDITDVKKRQNQDEERFNNFYKQIAAANPNALAMFRLNLTKNTCTDVQSIYETARKQQSSGTVDGYLATCAEIIIDDEIKKDCLNRFTLPNLLKNFQNGIMDMSIEYPIHSSNGDTIWVNGIISMMQNSVSGDIEAISYALDITGQKLNDNILAQISDEKYDHIGLINPATHNYELWKKDAAYGLVPHDRVDYDETFADVLDHYIYQDDREVFEKHGKLENIVSHLNENGTDTFVYRIFNNGEFMYKQIKYVWLDSHHDLIIETQTDLTSVYEQQIEQVKRQHEAELAKERALNAESIPSGIGVFDYSDGILSANYTNDGFFQMIGMQRDDFNKSSGANVLDRVFEEDRRALSDEIDASISEKRQLRCRFRMVDGDVFGRWVEIAANHIQLNDKTERFYVAFYDVDELIRTQIDMREKELIFRDILSYSEIIHFTYYPKLHRYEAEILPSRLQYLPNVMDDYPDSFIRFIGLNEADAKAYRDMIKAIDEGVPEAECTTLMRFGEKSGWYRVHMFSVLDDSGKTIKAIGNIFNVDSAVEAEKAISDEKMRMESLRGVYLAVGSFDVTKDTKITSEAGDGLERTVEIDAEALKDAEIAEPGVSSQRPETLSVLISAAKLIPDEAERHNFIRCCSHKGMMQLYLNGKRDVTFEYRRTSGEELMWVSTRVILMEEPSTKDVLAFFYTRDISEKKKTEQITRLTIGKNYDYVALLNVVKRTIKFKSTSYEDEIKRDGWKTDADNDYDRSIEVAIKSFSPEKNDDKLIEQVSIESIVLNLEKSDEYTVTFDMVVLDGNIGRKQIQYRWLDDTKTEILVSQVDITATYIKEQERTRQLKDALEAAEEANKAKTEFISRISHDIRTPINAIMNLTAFAKEDMNDHKKLLHDLNGVEASNTFLLSLINDVLDISKIDSGAVELHPEPYPYGEYIDNIRSIFEPMCKQHGQTFNIVCDKSGTDRGVFVDRVRYNQIALNLLSNAVKYTPEGGTITYTSHGRRRSDGLIECSFEVMDTGIGMSEQFQKNMFEPFTQEYDNPERSKFSSGTGLGLSIVKRLIDLMGGTITVESELGKGTKVSVRLILPKADITKAVKDAAASGEIIKRRKLYGRVLLAEDNEINTEVALRILDSFGLEVEHADNGKKAVELFSTSSDYYYCAILMDIQMPVMNGYDATADIRGLEKPDAKTIPIIALTADAFAGSIDVAKKSGMDDYVTKPIDPDKLYETLSKILVK